MRDHEACQLAGSFGHWLAVGYFPAAILRITLQQWLRVSLPLLPFGREIFCKPQSANY